MRGNYGSLNADKAQYPIKLNIYYIKSNYQLHFNYFSFILPGTKY